MTIRLLLLFVFTACAQDKKKDAQQHLVSAIISTDSVIIYSGKLSMTTPFQKIAFEETKVKEILADKKDKAGKPVTILLKLSSEGAGSGTLGQAANIKNWSEDLGITNFERVDGDAMDIARFNADTGTWRYIDNMLSNPPKLRMPREEGATKDYNWEPPVPVKVSTPTSVTTQTLPENNAFLIEIRKDNSVWYQVISRVTKMAPQKIDKPITKNLQEIIAGYEKSATDGPKTYLIKGDNKATYPVFEQVINALKANSIYKYNLVTADN